MPEFSSRALKRAFEDPGREYAPMPLWVWNGAVTRQRITEVLEQFRARGIGGSFIHPRPSLVTEYLSEEWFELWSFALEEAERLGLECHIYDENSYPSGFAGGHVPALDPSTQVENLILQKGEEGGSKIIRLQTAPDAWTAGFAYVDLARKRSTQLFIELTHAQYGKHVGHAFGRSIRYVFTDEPTLKCHDGFNVSRDLFNCFHKDHGYDLEPIVDQLMDCDDLGRSIRFDYFRTLQRMFTQAFLRPLHDWCSNNGLGFAGHFDEHNWPYPASCPNSMASQRWMQCPGIDLLGFQFFPDKFKDLSEPHRNLYLMTVKEVTSVGFQLGRERILCETTGGGGYDMGLSEFKAIDDYVLTYGVSLINPHLSHQTLAGARKFDWPHTYSDHSPWWDAYEELARYETRFAWATANARRRHRVLVLQPTLTGWLYYLPESFRSADKKDQMTARLEQLRESQPQLIGRLRDYQVDFDLGDELILEEMGEVTEKQLQVGRCFYDLVVIPPNMEVMLGATAELLRRFLAAGGQLLALEEPPALVDGRPDDRAVKLAQRYSGSWRMMESVEALCLEVRSLLPPAITQADGSPLPSGINHDFGTAPDGSRLHFLSNETRLPISLSLSFPGSRVERWDAESGEVTVLECEEDRDCDASLTIEGWGSLILREISSGSTIGEQGAAKTSLDLCSASLDLAAIVRKEPNVLPLWYCDLETGGRCFSRLHVTTASDQVWRAHGFERSPWEWAVQFRRNLVDQRFEEGSGYKQVFYFKINPGVDLSSISVAVERAWLYNVSVNGQTIDARAGERWFDENFRRLDISNALLIGDNRLELECCPMHPLAEVAPAYLIGDFSLITSSDGFDIGSSQPLRMGKWLDLGHQFYPGGISYTFSFDLIEEAKGIQVTLPDFIGNSAASVAINGETFGWIWKSPHELTIRRPFRRGQHSLEIEIKGNLRNMLGPHFAHSLPVVWSWRNHPKGPAPGDAYSFTPTGLTRPPILSYFTQAAQT